MSEFAEKLQGRSWWYRVSAYLVFWLIFIVSGPLYKFARDNAPCYEIGVLSGEMLAALSRLVAGPTILTIGTLIFLPMALRSLKFGCFPAPGSRVLSDVKYVYGVRAKLAAWGILLGSFIGISYTIYSMISRFNITQLLSTSGDWPVC